LLVVSCWLLVVGCWLLVVGCWLLVVGSLSPTLSEGKGDATYFSAGASVVTRADMLVASRHFILQKKSDFSCCGETPPNYCHELKTRAS